MLGLRLAAWQPRHAPYAADGPRTLQPMSDGYVILSPASSRAPTCLGMPAHCTFVIPTEGNTACAATAATARAGMRAGWLPSSWMGTAALPGEQASSCRLHCLRRRGCSVTSTCNRTGRSHRCVQKRLCCNSNTAAVLPTLELCVTYLHSSCIVMCSKQAAEVVDRLRSKPAAAGPTCLLAQASNAPSGSSTHASAPLLLLVAASELRPAV